MHAPLNLDVDFTIWEFQCLEISVNAKQPVNIRLPFLSMEATALCERCHQLTQATCAALPSWDKTKQNYMFIENRCESQQSPAEMRLRSRYLSMMQRFPLRPFGWYGIRWAEIQQKQIEQIWVHKSLQEMSAILATRAAKCHLCRLICAHLGIKEGPTDKYTAVLGQAFVIPILEYHAGDTVGTLTVTLLSADLELASLAETYILHELKDKHEFKLQKPGPRRSPSQSRAQAVSKWLQTCVREHPECTEQDFDTSLPLPTRLLHLTRSLGSDPPEIIVKLVETSRLAQSSRRLRYSTLSHRWSAGSASLKLLKENYDSWCMNIPWNLLSSTFRRAIETSLALDIEYIWIDSLVIIQNDKEDWNREAPRMQAVYAGGFVNIAATFDESEADWVGFERKNDWLFGCGLEFKLNGSLQLQGSWRVLADWDPYERHVLFQPLNYRAWVFQESILSPRIIHITRFEEFWECRSHCDSYWKLYGRPARPVLEDNWSNLVAMYSRRKLSHTNDRLIAMAGVAEAYAKRHKISPSDYLAGWWRHDLRQSLLWRSEPEQHRTQAPNIEVAPSWSWASRESAIICPLYLYERDIFHPDYQILEANTTPKFQSSFGPVESSFLRISVMLFRLDGPSYLDVKKGQQTLVTFGEGAKRLIARSHVPDVDAHGTPKPLYVAPLNLTRLDYWWKLDYGWKLDYWWKAAFLILQPVAGQRGKFFKVNCCDSELFKGLVPPSWWYQGDDTLESSLYQKNLGNGVYEIELL